MRKPIDKPMVQQEHPLGAEIVSLAAQSYKLAHDLLEKLREFDDAHGWIGFASCAHWLSYRTSLNMGAARLGEDQVFRHTDGCPITNELPFVAYPIAKPGYTWTIPSPSSEPLDYSYASSTIIHNAELRATAA